MWIIGELLNCTRKRVGAAAEKRDADFVRDLARKQAGAGANMLDVNGGLAGREVETLEWMVEIVQETTDLPLSIDSSDPRALRSALPLCKQRPLLNSITDEAARFDALMPVLKEHRPKVIALCMTESGPPSGADDRVATASRLVDRLTAAGIQLDSIYVDPCVMPISTSPEQGAALLDAVPRIVERYPGVHVSVGLSNVSFGLPARKLVNQVFLMLLMARGLDAAILDPCDPQLMANLAAAEALLGHDEFCVGYLKAFREGKLEAAMA
ncbi:MAG: dihydropteroate synthase [Bryobacteraceae bacterium]